VDQLSATTEVLPDAFPILDVAGLNAGRSAIAAELAGCLVVGASAATTRPIVRPSRERSFCLAVPELTRNAGIQLNARLSLRRQLGALTSARRMFPESGPTVAKPSDDHFTLGGLVRFAVNTGTFGVEKD
jgi:hypothetical protein